jgi:hypothetical protein
MPSRVPFSPGEWVKKTHRLATARMLQSGRMEYKEKVPTQKYAQSRDWRVGDFCCLDMVLPARTSHIITRSYRAVSFDR